MRVRQFVLALWTGAVFVLPAGAEPAVPPIAGSQAPIILRPPPGVTPIPQAAVPAVPGAPAATAPRVRGVIQTFDGPFLTLKLPDKSIVTLGMTTATRIAHNRVLGLAGLQVGAYVSVVALKGADGKLRAQGVRLYPESARGQGEGQYPLDAAATRITTNGTITAFTPGGVGGTLSVSFHGAAEHAALECVGHADPGGQGCNGAAAFQVARGIPVVAIEAGDVSLLLPGATVSVNATSAAGGLAVAVALTIEKDPPPPKTH